MATRKQPPTVRLRRLASELRRLRQAAGLTREDAADQTNMNSATLWRIETARARPQRRTLLALLDKYGVSDQKRRAELVDLAKDAVRLDWLQSYEDLLPDEYATYISFEAEARSVRNYESQFIPGLLQTESYAHTVLVGLLPNVGKSDIEQRVNARLRRQESIVKETPLKFWAIIDEAVLRRKVGTPEVMRQQREHLLKQAELPNVTLQVLPYDAGAHPGMHGAFAIMDFADPADADLVYLENMTGAVLLERPTDIEHYTTMFEHLRAISLGPAESIKMIDQLYERSKA